MNSKSDEKLRAELGGKPQRVTHAEARAAEKGKPQRAARKSTDGDDTGDGAAAAKTPRVRIAPGSKPSAVLAAHITDAAILAQAARLKKGEDEGDVKALGKAIDGLAKKVGEKAVNLIRNRSNPAGIQVYTRIALDHLIDNGTMTSKDLITAYSGTYKDGTCRAQSNQIMQLFPALGIAERPDRGTLKLDRDSAIVADYKKAAKAAARQTAAA